MPQMSPLLWLNLYIVFTLTLAVFIAMFFFSKTPSNAPEASFNPDGQKLSWKW